MTYGEVVSACLVAIGIAKLVQAVVDIVMGGKL
jgi:hypothetical protein